MLCQVGLIYATVFHNKKILAGDMTMSMSLSSEEFKILLLSDSVNEASFTGL